MSSRMWDEKHIVLKKNYRGFDYCIADTRKFSNGIGNARPNSPYNGYVRIPKNAVIMTEYNNHSEYELDVDCHGGITYDQQEDNGKGDVVIGFDTGHYGDEERGCDISYVENECKSIIDQFYNNDIKFVEPAKIKLAIINKILSKK